MKRILVTMMFGTLLTGTVALRADDDHDKHRERTQERRYYDSNHRDYHTWNDAEDQAYRRYLNENRHEYREFERMNKRDQLRYFKWRHEHEEHQEHEHRDR